MARGRMIAASVADDKRFNELPIDAALVYLMAIPQLDRDGLILGEPAALWGQVCRRRYDLLARMADIISAWEASGLVSSYQTDDGDTVLHFAGFQKNQAMTHYDREAASRFPCPPGYVRTDKGLALESLRTNSGLTPDEVPPNVIESKLNTNVPANAVPAALTPLSDQFAALVEELKTTNNKAAALHHAYVAWYGPNGAPDYGYIGKVAKQVGGAGRLAQLMFELVPRPPVGDVLAYIVAEENARKKRAAQTGGNREISEVTFAANGADIYG